MLLPLAIAVGGGAFALHRMALRFDDASGQALTEVVPISDVRVQLGPASSSRYEVMVGLENRAEFRRHAGVITRRLSQLVAGAEIAESRGDLEEARAAWVTYVATFDRVLDAHRPTSAKLSSELSSELSTRLAVVDRHLAAAQTDAVRAVRRETAAARRLAREVAWSYAALALAAVVGGFAIALALARLVLRPIWRLRAGVQRISDGDLTSPIALVRRDEFGDLSDSIDAMARDLRTAHGELEYRALHDELTGLPNRTLLLDRIDQLNRRLGQRHGTGALLLVDLDDFKVVNDTMGHPAGDSLLVLIAQRLQIELRDIDTAARIGGDEFALLLENLEDDAEAIAVADRVRRAIAESCEIEGSEVRAQASIGIVTMHDGDVTSADLLRNADLAMYAAKRAGKRRCEVFQREMHSNAIERASMERDLRNAVRRDELVLHYQPVIDLNSGRVTGFEALVRWNHPELGMMPPVKFIPLAEETGIIVPLGRWVLRRACSQLRDWQRIDPDRYGALTVAVNLSACQLEREGVVSDVQYALEQTGLDPTSLVLELTESMIASGEDLLDRLNALKALGVRLAVDDFGTGYSSLAYLRQFPIDVLKIDRSFVANITTRQADATLAKTIIELGRMLELTTVAEGIEDAEQLDLLRTLGCRMGQGYLIARPLPADEFEAFIAARPVVPLEPAGGPAPARDESPAPAASDPPSRALLDHTADAVILVGADGLLLYANEATRRLIGYDVADLIGRNVFDLVHPDDMAGVLDAYVSTVATPGVKLPLAFRVQHIDGPWIPIEIVTNNMLDEPSVAGLVIAIRDRREVSIDALYGTPVTQGR
ncbi:MAG: diguanylate cyclase [Actinomycetia bacterium]|nr:diguanylate cyclase [Actinomycetes bacterium]